MTTTGEGNRCRRGRGSFAALALIIISALRCAGNAADVSIAPSVANLFVGEEKIVEGRVTNAERDANVVHLRLGTVPRDLTVSLVIGLLSNFPEAPERYYLGKTVRVVGTIQSFRGALEMTVHDPEHIQVIDGVSAPGHDNPLAPVSHVAAPETAPERVDALRTRVRELEERVRQLERARAPDTAR